MSTPEANNRRSLIALSLATLLWIASVAFCAFPYGDMCSGGLRVLLKAYPLTLAIALAVQFSRRIPVVIQTLAIVLATAISLVSFCVLLFDFARGVA